MQGNKMENLNFIWSECKCLSRKWEYSSLFVSSYSQVYNRYYYILEAFVKTIVNRTYFQPNGFDAILWHIVNVPTINLANIVEVEPWAR